MKPKKPSPDDPKTGRSRDEDRPRSIEGGRTGPDVPQVPSLDPTAVRIFLDDVWNEGLPDGSALPLTAMTGTVGEDGKRASRVSGIRFAGTVDAAVQWVLERDAAGEDVYAATAAITVARAGELERAEKPSRGKAADAAWMPGFYLDLDVGPGKFDSMSDAVAFATGDILPFPPSTLVGSGGGVHAWWLFHEPEDVAGELVRRAEARIHGWSLVARHEAARHYAGARVDAVWDLARIYRIPGTRNRKKERPRAVTLIEETGRRYNFAEFDTFAVEPTRATAGQGSALEKMGAFVVNAGADVGASKFNALAENFPEFLAIWNHTKKDIQDASLSGHDWNLALHAAGAGWSTQEIVDLLVAHRERFAHLASDSHRRDPLRLKSPGYYAATVAKAVEAASKMRAAAASDAEDERVAREITETASALAEAEASGERDEFSEANARRQVMAFFRKHVGVELVSVQRFGDMVGMWEARLLVRGQERVETFANRKALHSWPDWRDVAIEAERAPARKPPSGWDAMLALMHRVVVEKVEGSSPDEMLRDYVVSKCWGRASDIQRADLRDDDDADAESIVKRRSASLEAWGYFREGDAILIHPGTFVDRGWDVAAVRPFRDARALAAVLKRLGGESRVVAVVGTTRRIVRLRVG